MLISEGRGEATESGSAGQNLALTPMITTASEGGMNSNRGTTLKEYDLQMDAAASVILGYDVTVIAATSDGKSFCYQLIAMLEAERTLLVVCPLIALMVEQVLKNAALGYKSMSSECSRVTSKAKASGGGVSRVISSCACMP